MGELGSELGTFKKSLSAALANAAKAGLGIAAKSSAWEPTNAAGAAVRTRATLLYTLSTVDISMHVYVR